MAEKVLTEYKITEFCGKGEKVFGIFGKDILTQETFGIKKVSADFNTVAALVEKLNRNEVSLTHFYDVVRDAVYEASVLAVE